MQSTPVGTARRATAQRLLQLRLQAAKARLGRKASRGHALTRVEPEAPVKARPVALDRAMPASDAFHAVLQAGAAHLRANESGMLRGRDPEYLHQMRVALRRLRAALGVFTPILPALKVAALRAELKWLAACLGPARDWDVFVTETLPLIESEFRQPEEWRGFIARCGKLRRTAGLRARRAVRSARYRNLMHLLAAGIALPGLPTPFGHGARAGLQPAIGDYAAAVLEWRHQRAEKRGRRLGRQSPGALHRFRIAIKNFRYAADSFAGLYGTRAAREALQRLSRLQDILGAMNDAAAAASLAGRALGGNPGRCEREVRRSLLAWSRRRVATLTRGLKGAWKEFRAAKRFW